MTTGTAARRSGHPRLLEERVDVRAAPARVWELVGDPRRMAEWSPQVEACTLVDEPAEVGRGTRFVNHNIEGGDLRWTTHGEVVQHEPERIIAFRIAENWAVWSLVLEPLADGGTRVVERRETPDGISDLAIELTDAFMGGAGPFTDTLRAGMRETLARVKAAAEG